MKPTIDLPLITSGSCNCRCKSCPAGRKERGIATGVMSLDMAERILDKAIKEAHVAVCALYYYNEPFLIPHIADIVLACRNRNVPSRISTNLNFFDKYGPSVMRAAPDTLMISMSGFTQSTYERSHKGGHIEVVKDNMAKVAKLRAPRTYVQVSWHEYPYNRHEKHKMKKLAESLGFAFVSYATYLMPPEETLKAWEKGINPPSSEDLFVKPTEMKRWCLDRKWFPCPVQDSCIAVNPDGEYANCGSRFDMSTLRGSFFDTSVSEILMKRKSDPECVSCKAVAGHVLACQTWTRSKWSMSLLAGMAARKLGVYGLTRRFLNQAAYTRRLLPYAG